MGRVISPFTIVTISEFYEVKKRKKNLLDILASFIITHCQILTFTMTPGEEHRSQGDGWGCRGVRGAPSRLPTPGGACVHRSRKNQETCL